MAKKKYSPVLQRLGALDVNDDILKEEHKALITKYNNLLVAFKEINKEHMLLNTRCNRLKRENKELEKIVDYDIDKKACSSRSLTDEKKKVLRDQSPYDLSGMSRDKVGRIKSKLARDNARDEIFRMPRLRV